MVISDRRAILSSQVFDDRSKMFEDVIFIASKVDGARVNRSSGYGVGLNTVVIYIL